MARPQYVSAIPSLGSPLPVRIAVLSDIHSNLEALQTALRAIERIGVDKVYCLGDVVGYNANPVECLHLVQKHCAGVVVGNHDLAVATGEGISLLPDNAQKAALHNRDLLSDTLREEILSWPDTLVEDGCTFVHATPDAPRDWKRVQSFASAREQFDHFDTDICFIGHTHIPSVVSDRLGVLQVREGHRFLINTGSIGQSRDGNPRLSFSLFDTKTITYRNVRLEYDVQTAARKIIGAGLPERLAERLKSGN